MHSSGATKACLHIGDTVLLSTQLQRCSGYVYKELSSSHYNFMTVFPNADRPRNDPQFPNVAFATFKVLARNKHNKKQDLDHLLEKPEVDERDLQAARKAVEEEIIENEQEQHKKYGTKVMYGDVIQFLHTASNQFLTANSEASRTEGNHLLVNLCGENSEGAVFKVLPRYKVKSIGDEVHYDDQIKLESSKTPGQYLHTSNLPLGQTGITIHETYYELNLSASESSLQLRCFATYRNSPYGFSYWLKAGDCIRLFHKQDECYMVAEGSFAETQNRVTEDVHCRQRHVDQRRNSRLPSSANTFWQIEKEALPDTTSIIYWRERIRIKHMPTRLYLAVCKVSDDNWEVTLKEDVHRQDLETLFSFHPLIQEEPDVLLESYALIQHCSSRHWLHLDKVNFKRISSFADDDGLKGLQKDSAELYQLSVSAERLDYDAFTIQEVSRGLLLNFNYVAGILPILANHLIVTQESVPLNMTNNNIVSAVVELGDWLVTDDERETKDRQKLLRNLRVLAHLIEMLKKSNHYTATVPHYKRLSRECYKVLTRYLDGESRKNENYLAQFIEFFQSQVDQELNTEDLLVEIVQNNLAIVSRMAKTQMTEMIKKFREKKDHRFLDFLSSLCVCSGRPIPSTQDRLLKELQLNSDRELFIRTKILKDADGKNTRLICYRQKESDGIEISELEGLTKERRAKESALTKADYKIFIAQLHLFAQLCKGNNKTSIDLLTYPTNEDGFVSFEEAMLCVQNKKLSFTLRTKYVELLLVMFVDVGENINFLDNLTFSFISEEIVEDPYADTGCANGEMEALTKVVNKHFPDLKVWLLKTINKAKIYFSENKSNENHYLARVINILVYLVRFGYYDDMEDVNESSKCLLSLLTQQAQIEKKIVTEEISMDQLSRIDCSQNRPIFAIKAKILEVLLLFHKFQFYVKLQKFIYDFKLLRGGERRVVGNTLEAAIPSNRSLPMKLGQLRVNVPKDDQFLYSKDMRSVVHSRLNHLGEGLKLTSIPLNDDLIKALVDISCFESKELNNLSLRLLLQLYFLEEDLFERARQTQLLVCKNSIDDFETVKKHLPKLRHLLRLDPDQKTYEDMIELLDIFCSLCLISPDEPNLQNQIMLNNFGILSDILSYILDKGFIGRETTTTEDENEVPIACRKVYQKCFCLLKNLAADNKKVQSYLFGRVDDLLAIHVTGSNVLILADLADLLTEIFTGGPELVLKIKECQIERIFEIIIRCSNNAKVQAQFMLTLQALVKIEEMDLPVKRNQEMIIKNFCRLRGEFCKDVLGDKIKYQRTRRSILDFPETRKDPKLLVLLSATDMLAACAEGKNLFIESVCQNIFTVHELIDIISKPLPYLRKRPFIRFLIYVYMETADDTNSDRKYSLKHDNMMWSYLEKVASFLESINSVFCSVSQENSSFIKRQLSRRRTTMFSLKRPRFQQATLPDIIEEDGSLKSGVLEYLIDGVIPLIHTFYKHNYFSPKDAPSDLVAREIRTSSQIFSNLTLLQDEFIRLAATTAQRRLYLDTIRCLQELTDIAVGPSHRLTDEEIDSICHKHSDSLLDSTQYDPYKKQVELNKEFHRYCTNYCIAYKGPNIAHHQIGSIAIEKEYNDPGEELPLGPHFQNLLKLYFKNAEESASTSGEVRYEAEYVLYQLEVSRSQTIRLSVAEQEQQDTLDTRCLQLLRGLIHNRIKLIDPEEKERHPKRYRDKSEALFVPVQNQVQRFGDNGIQRVIPLLSHVRASIAQESLALIKAMLFGGNKNAQAGIAINAKETREETLFINLKRILENGSETYKSMRALKKRYSESVGDRNEVTSKPSTLERRLSTDRQIDRLQKETSIPIDAEDGELQHGKRGVFAESSDSNELSVIVQNDNNWITLVLEVIGLMCDGQHGVLQDYLRDQPDNFKTVNIVSEVANFLHTYTKDIVGSDLKQINQIIQTLIEMCVGNASNQQVIFDAVVIEPLNTLLEWGEKETFCDKPKCSACEKLILLITVKGSVMELLEIMLEETSARDAIAEGIGYAINVEAILKTMEMFHRFESHPLIKDEEKDDDCARGKFRAYNILACLKKQELIPSVAMEKHSEQKRDLLLRECGEKSLEIEIRYEGSDGVPVLAQVRFPYDPECKLRKEVKEVVRWNIDRDSMDDKHRALLQLMPSLKADIKQQRYLRKKPYLKPLVFLHKQRHYLLLFLTFLLNILLLFVYRVPVHLRGSDSNNPLIPETKLWFRICIYVFGSMHTILGVWMVAEYFFIYWPHFRMPHWCYKARDKIVRKFRKFKPFQKMAEKEEYNKKKKSTCLHVNVFGTMTVYMIVFVLCSILSLPFYGYFYPICLLYIIVNNDILQRVLRAVTKNGDSLIMVAIFGLIVLFIYAVVSFAFLHSSFVQNSNNDDLYCATLYECMYSVLRFGLLDNIGLTLPLNGTDPASAPLFSPEFHFTRLIFDLSFFILVITIGLNVVFGIIVDTFSQLREERSNVVDDEKTTCFICNLPSHEFDRKGKGFKHHVSKEHNMWSYVYYSFYLDYIDTGDHNAIQKYVFEKIESDSASFFPQEEAKCLTTGIESSDTIMSDVLSKVDQILHLFNRKAEQKSENAKRRNQEQWDQQHK